MKKRSLYTVATVALLVLSLVVYLSACGGGGGSNGGGGGNGGGGTTPVDWGGGTQPPSTPTVQTTPTSLGTTTQGAQAAQAGVSIAQGSANMSTMLSGLVGSGSTPAPKFPGQALAGSKAVESFTAKAKPFVAKARAFRSTIMSAQTTTTMTEPCTNGGTMTITATYDTVTQAPSSITMTAKNCQEGTDLSNGTMAITLTQTGGTIKMTNFSDKTCTDMSCTSFSSESTANIEMSFSQTATGMSLAANGWAKDVDNVHSITDITAMTNFRMTEAMTAEQTLQVLTLTLNGAVSSSHQETNNDHADATAFQDMTLVNKWDASNEYFSIDGKLAIATTPANTCIDGTFVFDTLTPFHYDNAVGHNVAGHMTINSNVDIVANADGTITVTVGGTPHTYTEAELSTMCPL